MKTKSRRARVVGDELLPQLRPDRTMNNLGREFLQAAERGNAPMVAAFIEEGFPAKFQNRVTGGNGVAYFRRHGERAGAARACQGSELCDFPASG